MLTSRCPGRLPHEHKVGRCQVLTLDWRVRAQGSDLESGQAALLLGRLCRPHNDQLARHEVQNMQRALLPCSALPTSKHVQAVSTWHVVLLPPRNGVTAPSRGHLVRQVQSEV